MANDTTIKTRHRSDRIYPDIGTYKKDTTGYTNKQKKKIEKKIKKKQPCTSGSSTTVTLNQPSVVRKNRRTRWMIKLKMKRKNISSQHTYKHTYRGTRKLNI